MVWKEVEEKAWYNWEKAEKHTHEEKGKDKVYGMSIGLDALLTMFVQEIVILMSDDDTGSQQPKWKRQAGKKGLVTLGPGRDKRKLD